jgi:apolipoprotein D and lipocalin family protein
MKILVLLFTLLLCQTACAGGSRDIRTASYVEINRYIGKWYAVSSLPQFFTRKCLSQTADYGIINSQMISVLNTCYKAKGTNNIKGQAVVTNAATNAELEVTFNNFFTRLFRVRGDYNILKLDENYRYVMVGSRDRKSLWIMSRTPSIEAEVYKAYIEEAKNQGFPIEKLVLSKF